MIGVLLMSSAGIIPARAGFTDVPPASDFGYEDHPRSRGVYPGLHYLEG